MRLSASRTVPGVMLCACLALALALALPQAALASSKAPAPDRKAILLVVFGTSNAEGAKAYDGLKAAAEKACPGLPVRLAYTSSHARATARDTGAADWPSPAQALARLADEGFTHVAVQSLHIMPGQEFHDLAATASALEGLPKGLKRVTLGLPLLSGEADLKLAAKALLKEARPSGSTNETPAEALIFVGHGTSHPGNMAYPALQYFLWRQDRLALVGVIDGSPGLDDVLSELKARRPASVRLIPLLSVAGEHAKTDIAGPGKDSWLSAIRAAGFPCTVDLRGLIERPEIAALWLAHLRTAVQKLNAQEPGN
jgi:sirohydrochlorin cobaltochelatase